MTTKVLIRRRDNLVNDLILLDGEICFIKNDKTFYVGDGNSQMNNLTPFSSLVAGDDGNVYAVRVDKNGTPCAKQVKMYHKGRLLEFKVSE